MAAQPITYDPPVKDPAELKPVLEAKSDAPGDVVPCYVQKEPAHKLINLEKIPVVYLSAEGGYHREYDPCLAKWLNQAGVHTQFVRAGGRGHSRQRPRDDAGEKQRRNRQVHRQLDGQERSGERQDPTMAMPPSAIPTFSTENIARQGFFYAGGKYVGEAGKEVMGDAMYTEVWVPKQLRASVSDRILPRQWADRRRLAADAGQPARVGPITWWRKAIPFIWWITRRAGGRLTCPAVDGKLGIRTALDLETIWTAPATSGGNFPRMKLYTQWPSDSPKKGMMGDPVFDYFTKGQLQFVANQDELTVPAGVALLDMIGKPVILITHSQGGGMGFDVANQRPKLSPAWWRSSRAVRRLATWTPQRWNTRA